MGSMKRMAVSEVALALLLISVLAFNVPPASADGTIYIRADGSVDPSTAPIQRDGDVYTLTDDIYYEGIVIERSNIIVDGNGHTLQGFGQFMGFTLSYINNVTIKRTKITYYNYGIYLYASDNNTLSNNTVKNIDDYYGIYLYYSSGNTLSNNTVTNNVYQGILLYYSSGNTLSNNNATNNESGIVLEDSDNNTLYNNTAANNSFGIGLIDSDNNTLSNNNANNNYYHGISLWDSSGNTLSNNNATKQ